MDFCKDRPLHLWSHLTSFSFLHYNLFAANFSLTLRELRIYPCIYRLYFCCANTNICLNHPSNIHFDRKIQKDYSNNLRLCTYGPGNVLGWNIENTWNIQLSSLHYYRSSNYGIWSRYDHYSNIA